MDNNKQEVIVSYRMLRLMEESISTLNDYGKDGWHLVSACIEHGRTVFYLQKRIEKIKTNELT